MLATWGSILRCAPEPKRPDVSVVYRLAQIRNLAEHNQPDVETMMPDRERLAKGQIHT